MHFDNQNLRFLLNSALNEWNRRHYHRKMIISIEEYVGIHANSPDWTIERETNAVNLLIACANMQKKMEQQGIVFQINPKTNSEVSGEIYGGFRPQNCPIGAVHSNHRSGQAVDIFDPGNVIDEWLVNNEDMLVECGIYIEAPGSTPGWSHWQTKIPLSGKHIFSP